jgi:hypothetical protein
MNVRPINHGLKFLEGTTITCVSNVGHHMSPIIAKAGEMPLEISEIYSGVTICEIFRGCLTPFDKKSFF